MKSLTRPLLAAAVLTAASLSSASAATTGLLNVDLGPVTDKTGAAVLGTTGDLWNTINSTGTAGAQLIAPTLLNWADGTGSSGISFSISSGINNNGNFGSTSDGLMKDYVYLYTASASTVTVTLSGFTANQTLQSLVFYGAGDTVGQNSSFTIAGVTKTTSAATVSAPDFTTDGNQFVRFDNVQADSSGVLSITWDNPVGGQAFSAFNGMQISAVPEPSTYGLIGAGALASVAFVRRRRRHAGTAA